MNTLAQSQTARRMACIDLPELPLQLVMRKEPALRDKPVALVAEDKPEAELLWLNRRARQMQLRTGMRFGVAKSLLPELVPRLVSAAELEQMALELVQGLQTFSPHVERDPVHMGVFYVDPGGLASLYGGEASWGRCLHRYLWSRGFYAALVVSPSRVLSYALARTTRGVRVVESFAQAVQLAREVPLERLHLAPKLRDGLARIGLTTLGDLARFGPDQLALRFGREAAHYCRALAGEEVLPLSAEPHIDIPRVEVEVEPADDDVARLCFGMKRALDLLLEQVRARGASIRAVWLRLGLERHPVVAQRLEPSTPTRDMPALLELLRLRLGTVSLPSKVVSIVLEAETAELAPGQLRMFVPKRDLAAGDRALARLRANYGDEVVRCMALADAHVPEQKFRYAPLPQLKLAQPAEDLPLRAMPLVRRMLPKPELLTCTLVSEPESRCLVHAGKRYALRGPYRVSSGWWVKDVARDYYYALSEGSALWWVFFDRLKNSWFLQGVVD